jgi:L-threonylcarbamoyladenylate synthase
MPTEILRIHRDKPEGKILARAAQVLRDGGLVAFPTETVYGLGANALDGKAVARIFAAKGRPATNPLIVHVTSAAEAGLVARAFPDVAERLAERFWPGPLTLILPKRAEVPKGVTAGLDTVAVRVPDHPVAKSLLERTQLPLAAPSANRSSHLSPTTAEHVLRGLKDRIDLLLDAGPTPGGLESTVLDVTCTPPRLLRPGLVSPAEIEAIIGPIARPAAAGAAGSAMPSPGMLSRHYAPRATLECIDGDAVARVESWLGKGETVGWLTFTEPVEIPTGLTVEVMPRDPAVYASRLYAVLHALDDAGVTRIVVEAPPSTDAWLAVRDRLQRAAAKE